MNKQTGDVVAVSSQAAWDWQEISQEEWAGLFPLGIGAPDIDSYKNPQVMKLSSRYYLLYMDGELWFGDYRSDKVGMWSIYSLVPESSVDATESTLGSFHIAPATDELLNKYETVHEYINDGDGVRLIIRTDTEVRNFAFVSLNHIETEGILSFQSKGILFSVDELSPEKPFMVKLMIPGSAPTYGISFVDENGVERLFSIHLSGRGAEEAPPYLLLEENGNSTIDTESVLP